MPPSDAEQRVFNEHQELSERMAALDRFLLDRSNERVVGTRQWGLLHSQFGAMSLYRDILATRLREWPANAE